MAALTRVRRALLPYVVAAAAACAPRAPRAPAPMDLVGTEWLLEDLAGTGVLDDVQATLAFLPGDRVAGRASCNRFNGSLRREGDRLTPGAMATTKMACPPAIDAQERAYLAALGAAERVAMDGPHLLVYAKGYDKPLRYTRLTKPGS